MLATEGVILQQLDAKRLFVEQQVKQQLACQLKDLGVRAGDLLMVHASFKSLGIRDPEIVVQALLNVLGDQGTLLMPALSYCQKPGDVHDARTTPSCAGYLSEYFRTRPGTLRSLHPTHSVCSVGPAAIEALEFHILDKTPCGLNSPFNYLLHHSGKILMVGCGLQPNTSMHAVEEYIRPPYLLSRPKVYTITDSDGNTFRKAYYPHQFWGVNQRYDRLGEILFPPSLRTGKAGEADCQLIEAGSLFETALEKLREDPFYFVEPTAENEH